MILEVPIQIKRGLEADLPASMQEGRLYGCLDSGKLFIGTGTGTKQLGGGGGSVWGLITGTLSDQADLAAALAALASSVSAETSRAEGAESTLQANITSEASTRSSADGVLTSAISTETSRAEAAEALLAPLASPSLTGTPTTPTKAPSTNNTDIASTAYADAAVAVEASRATAAEALLVPKTTTVNGHALSANVVVSASDLATGTLPHAQLPALLSGDIPNNAANTTGSAASLSVSGQTGVVTVTGLASTSRVKTVRDAADTLLELGGSYSPTGSWTSMTFVAPVLGTPASGALTNCTSLPAASVNAGALANGMTATTQSALDSSTKLSTTSYTDAAVAVETAARTTAVATKQNTLTGTGLVRQTGAATELSGDVTTSGSNVTTLKNTGTSGTYTKVTTDAAGRVSSGTTLASGDIPNNAANTSGTAANLSGTPALPNGTTATTQAAGNNSTNLATTAYVDAPASGGTPIVNIPFGLGGILACAAPGTSAFGASNVQEEIYFVCDEDFTINNVAILEGTGVSGALMDIAIYNAAGTTKLTSTGAFSLGTGVSNGVVKTALSASITLKKKTGYWLAWTWNSTGTPTIDNTLQSSAFQGMYNATVVRSGNSGTATSSGVTNSTIGTVSSALIRIPTMYFD
jgi:hypothetical protein